MACCQHAYGRDFGGRCTECGVAVPDPRDARISELEAEFRLVTEAKDAGWEEYDSAQRQRDYALDTLSEVVAERDSAIALLSKARLASGPDLSEGEAQVTAAMRQAGAEVLARMYLDGRGSESRGDGALMVYLAMERKRREEEK